MRDLLGAQRATTVDRHSVGAHTLDLGAKRDQKLGEILNVGLAGGVSKDSGASRSRSRDERVLGGSDAWLVEENVGAAKPSDAHIDHLPMREPRAELLQSEKMGVEPTASDHVAAWRRERYLTASSKQGRGE